MIEVVRTVETATPREVVAAYLADFTNTTEWDPNTKSCTRVDDGPITPGTEFDNVQKLGPTTSTFRYRVEEYEAGRRIVLTSDSRAMRLRDEMVFTDAGPGTRVTYSARLRPKGPAKLAEPLLRRGMNKIADGAAAKMQRVLDGL